MLNNTNFKSAMLDAIKTSGLLEAASLTMADAELRLNADFSNALAITFDAAGIEQHIETLTDYMALAMPALHGTRCQAFIEEGSVLAFAVMPTLETSADDFDEDEDLEDDIEPEDEDDEETLDEDELDAVADPAAPRGTDDKLAVLTTSDMHKIAGRLYSALGDADRNMGDYVGFLRELDALLGRYGGVPATPREEVVPEIAIYNEMASLATLLAQEEVAKKKGGKKGGFKEGRSGLLSALMGSMSGALGEKVQKYWDDLKSEEFRDAMMEVIKKAASKIDAETGEKAAVEQAELPVEPAPSEPTPIVVMVPLVNGSELQKWAMENGFKYTMSPDDFHATIAYSKKPIDWNIVEPLADPISIGPSSDRTVSKLGDQGAIVLHLTQEEAAPLKDRWARYREAGASWDYDDYTPHVTISWKDSFSDDELMEMKPYSGPLVFGPERQSAIKSEGFDVNKIKHVATT